MLGRKWEGGRRKNREKKREYGGGGCLWKGPLRDSVRVLIGRGLYIGKNLFQKEVVEKERTTPV